MPFVVSFFIKQGSSPEFVGSDRAMDEIRAQFQGMFLSAEK
jgi:hypothetical protein